MQCDEFESTDSKQILRLDILDLLDLATPIFYARADLTYEQHFAFCGAFSLRV